jgi:hypothetical protein
MTKKSLDQNILSQFTGSEHWYRFGLDPRITCTDGADRRLLIHAEHRRMRRRVHIQPNDVGRFALEVRIIRSHVAIEPLWLQSVFCPYPRHHHVRDRQRQPQFARAPMRRPVGRLVLQRPMQDPRLQSRRQLARPAPGMATEEPRQPLPSKPLAPAVDKRVVAVQLVPDLRPGMACCQQQDQPRSPSTVRPDRSGSSPDGSAPNVPLPSIRSCCS